MRASLLTFVICYLLIVIFIKGEIKMARPKKTTAKKTTTRGRKGTPATKRPPNNTDVPKTIIEMLNHDFGAIKEMLDNFAQHLRALDRMRLNGVGIKKQGFIRRTERGRGRACTDMTERVRTRRA